MKSELTTPLKLNLDLPSSPTNSSEATLPGLPHEDLSSSPEAATRENDSISQSSKKIRKKRTAYHKIDDDIRVQLLDAVKNGETLKSVAKKYNINYSSAKSVLHTYRKEGRILKKSGQEIPFQQIQYGFPLFDNADLSSLSNSKTSVSCKKGFPNNQNIFQNMDINRLNINMSPKNNFNANPSDGINLLNLLKLNSSSNSSQIEELPRMKHSYSDILPRFNQLLNNQEIPSLNHNTVNKESLALLLNRRSPANSGNLSEIFQGNSLDKYNLYRKYSSSPLSLGERIASNNVESAERRNFPKDIQSFSDMVNALQSRSFQQERLYDSCDGKFNVSQLLQSGLEAKFHPEEAKWNGKIENAAIDTYKTFMDAQVLLQKALKKASYLNGLMNFPQN